MTYTLCCITDRESIVIMCEVDSEVEGFATIYLVRPIYYLVRN